MFSIEPQRTPYDLNFSIFRVPVRVHPFFWLASVVMGWRGGDGQAEAATLILMWVGVVFVSILVHELGHAFTIRYFGNGARVVLYMMGGLAITESSRFESGFGSRSRDPRNHILVSLAGPAAGFVLAGLVIAAVYAGGGSVQFDASGGITPWIIKGVQNPYLRWLVQDLLFVNIFWGLVNLLPVFPLDGGQVSREVFQLYDPWNGMTRSLWLSIFAAAAVGVLGLAILRDSTGVFIALMFASLAFMNYQILQQLTGGGGFGGGGGGGFGGRPW